MPREKGVIFSDRSIPKIIAGTKTQTRRIIRDSWWGCLDPDWEPDRLQAIASGPHKTGDVIYIKEAWQENDPPSGYNYRADHPPLTSSGIRHHREGKWKNALFMPRKVARIYLTIQEVRIEQLTKISEEDAQAEGEATVALYIEAWEELHGVGSWSDDPWVWVISFCRNPLQR